MCLSVTTRRPSSAFVSRCLFGPPLPLLRFRMKLSVAGKKADTLGCYRPKVTLTHIHTHAQTDRPPQKRKITTMGNLPRTGRDDGQDTDAHARTHIHTHKHAAVPQGQGSGNASLLSLGGDSISQHAFLMWRGNYPWAVLRANRVCPLSSICLSPFLPFSLPLNPSLALRLCLFRP